MEVEGGSNCLTVGGGSPKGALTKCPARESASVSPLITHTHKAKSSVILVRVQEVEKFRQGYFFLRE